MRINVYSQELTDEVRAEMMRFFDDHIANAATAMAGQLEEEIRRALDTHWCNGWTYDDVRRRCVLQRIAHDPVETFIVDGVPLLHIWPVETEVERHEDRVVMHYTRQIRRLYTSREDGGRGMSEHQAPLPCNRCESPVGYDEARRDPQNDEPWCGCPLPSGD